MENPKKHPNDWGGYSDSWGQAERAAGCPFVQEARNILHLSTEQFCKLLDISFGTYMALVSGEEQLSPHQRIFIKEAIRIAEEKGFI